MKTQEATVQTSPLSLDDQYNHPKPSQIIDPIFENPDLDMGHYILDGVYGNGDGVLSRGDEWGGIRDHLDRKSRRVENLVNALQESLLNSEWREEHELDGEIWQTIQPYIEDPQLNSERTRVLMIWLSDYLRGMRPNDPSEKVIIYPKWQEYETNKAKEIFYYDVVPYGTSNPQDLPTEIWVPSDASSPGNYSIDALAEARQYGSRIIVVDRVDGYASEGITYFEENWLSTKTYNKSSYVYE